MFEVLDNISKVLTTIAPHNVLNTLINGGARAPIYHQGSFMEASGYHPQLSFNEIEPGVTFSTLDIPQTYIGQLDARDKAEFTIFNKTDHTKRFYLEFYQDLCQVEEISATTARCRYGDHPQIAPPRIVVIPPGGAEEIEFWYSTPPPPRKKPEYGDVLWIQVVVQITDEQGKRARLSAKSKAKTKPEWE